MLTSRAMLALTSALALSVAVLTGCKNDDKKVEAPAAAPASASATPSAPAGGPVPGAGVAGNGHGSGTALPAATQPGGPAVAASTTQRANPTTVPFTSTTPEVPAASGSAVIASKLLTQAKSDIDNGKWDAAEAALNQLIAMKERLSPDLRAGVEKTENDFQIGQRASRLRQAAPPPATTQSSDPLNK